MNNPIVGIACNAQMARYVKTLDKQPVDSLAAYTSLPILVDPRIKGMEAEVYHDREQWQARCKEQQEYDAKLLQLNKGWPGDGSGEDDLADHNANEADDYRDEG